MALRIRRIQLPRDFSSCSATATKYACEPTTTSDAELHLRSRARRSFARGKPVVTGWAMLAVLLAATAFVSPGRAVTLGEKGQARAVIIVPDRPSQVVENAARVLRDHIRQISGA